MNNNNNNNNNITEKSQIDFEFQVVTSDINQSKPYYTGSYRGYYILYALQNYIIPLDSAKIISSGFRAKIPIGYQFRMIEQVTLHHKECIVRYDTENPNQFIDLDLLITNHFFSHDARLQETINIVAGSNCIHMFIEKIPEADFNMIDSTDPELLKEIDLKTKAKEKAEEEEEYDDEREMKKLEAQDIKDSETTAYNYTVQKVEILQSMVSDSYYNRASKRKYKYTVMGYGIDNNNAADKLELSHIKVLIDLYMKRQKIKSIDIDDTIDRKAGIFSKQDVLEDMIVASTAHSWYKHFPYTTVEKDGLACYIFPTKGCQKKVNGKIERENEMHWHFIDSYGLQAVKDTNSQLYEVIGKYPIKLNKYFYPGENSWQYLKQLKMLISASEKIWTELQSISYKVL
jgi:hypothetical protein